MFYRVFSSNTTQFVCCVSVCWFLTAGLEFCEAVLTAEQAALYDADDDNDGGI